MRKEAAASTEALAAEKAAKFAADAEATELQKFLDETKAALEQQREFTQRLGTDAAKTKEELQAALKSKADLVMNSQGLTQVRCNTWTRSREFHVLRCHTLATPCVLLH